MASVRKQKQLSRIPRTSPFYFFIVSFLRRLDFISRDFCVRPPENVEQFQKRTSQPNDYDHGPVNETTISKWFYLKFEK